MDFEIIELIKRVVNLFFRTWSLEVRAFGLEIVLFWGGALFGTCGSVSPSVRCRQGQSKGEGGHPGASISACKVVRPSGNCGRLPGGWRESGHSGIWREEKEGGCPVGELGPLVTERSTSWVAAN